ncbi:MAG: PKD domain-containing protein [Chitinophagales bacterium]
MKKRVLVAFLLLFFIKFSVATHLVGGELSYKCLGGGQYEITLTIFRDDFNGQAPLDDPATITIFDRSNNSFDTVYYDFDLLNNAGSILPLDANPCITNRPTNVRIEKGVYKKIITLPANTSGYKIVYQRCCRNNAVANIFDDQGSTYEINIPNTNLCNSSPVFNNQPPLFLCANSKLDFDMSATDQNGDQLVYSLVAPLQGLDANDPTICPGIQGCNITRATTPPYDSIIYTNGFNSQKPLGANSVISINPVTGLLTVIPKTVGLFVVGIQVQEIRGGVVLGTSIRDFQFNVTNCAIASSAPIVITDNTAGSALQINDSTFSNCQGVTVRFDNNVSSQPSQTFFWDFGDPAVLTDTSAIKNPTYTYSDTGTYYATLIINKGKPCSDTSRIKIFYYPGLTTNFGYTPRCQNELIQFIDSSKSVYNDVTKWQWVLSAGDTTFIQNPTKLFTTSGTYNVQLTATTSRGCIGKVTKTVTVNPKPKAGFNANFLCFRHPATFTDASTISSGSITAYSWNFGDGFTDTLKNTTHTYNTFADSFSVRHVVSTALGCKDTIIKKIRMDDTVKISYITTPANICEKTPVTFTNTSTGGNPTAFQWIINNGAPVNGNTANVTFPIGGIFPVKLIATNRCGNDTLKSSVNVNSSPTVNLGSDVTVCNKSTKTITAAGAFDSLRWNTNENTSTITIDGNKTPINVTVFKNGCAGRDTILVKKQIITPGFSNNYLCLNKPVTFVNTSTINIGTLTQFDWKYGDGNSDNNIQNPTHAFTVFGNYNVQLIATSDIGCKDTFAKTILMDSILNVDFKTSELVTCQRRAVDFLNLTKGGVSNQFIWRIENNNFTTKDKSYTFLGTGIFPVKLVVSNRCYTDSLTKNIQIRPRPNVTLGRDTVLCKNQTASFTVNPALYDSIRWVNGTTSATLTDDGSINPLKVKVYLDGCAAEDTVNVNAPKFNLNFTNDFLCYNKAINFNNTSTVSYGSITNYNWNFGDGQSAAIKNPTHTYTIFGPKNIQLISTGSAGSCKDTITKIIAMDDSIFFNVNPVPADVCYGKTVQYTNQSTGGLNTSYAWNLNNANIQTGNIATYTHTFIGPNVIKLTATHRCGADTAKYNFSVLPLPRVNLGADSIIMCPGELKMIGINQQADSVFWSTGVRDQDSISIDGFTSPIKVEVYTKGCLAKDSVFVSTNCDIFIPTAFSPNNDGFNDLFNMMNKSIKSYTLRIYNRWGELVFETNDLNNGWNGTYKGTPCPVDSYTYIASGIRFNNESFYLKGILTLLR